MPNRPLFRWKDLGKILTRAKEFFLVTLTEQTVHIKDANQLLDAFYLPFESGWKRLDTGVINIAARTHMIGCTPAMIDWWLGFLHHSQEYRWWHPRDHVFSDWEGDCKPGEYLGRTHLAHEYIGSRLYKLKINFRDPGEILDKRRFAEAKVGTAVYGYVGAIGENGWFGRLLHLIQDTPEGCVMRSRFWLGEIDPEPNPKPTPETLQKLVPDELGAGLFAHCCEEMSILAGFLPTVYRIHKADTERPKTHLLPHSVPRRNPPLDNAARSPQILSEIHRTAEIDRDDSWRNVEWSGISWSKPRRVNQRIGQMHAHLIH